MGNDIARQFGHLPAEEAAVQVGTHLQKFWEPRMRRRLHELLSPGSGHREEADPLLVAGLVRLERDDTDDAERRKATGG
jgi:formate dehydrogenase subunit delta